MGLRLVGRLLVSYFAVNRIADGVASWFTKSKPDLRSADLIEH